MMIYHSARGVARNEGGDRAPKKLSPFELSFDSLVSGYEIGNKAPNTTKLPTSPCL